VGVTVGANVGLGVATGACRGRDAGVGVADIVLVFEPAADTILRSETIRVEKHPKTPTKTNLFNIFMKPILQEKKPA
jgi:hypothetical protein